jgi:hypothetical protein
MKIGEFINKISGLNVTNNAGINANSTLNETFLDFTFEVLSYLVSKGCATSISSGNTTRPEYKLGSAIFITFVGDNSDTCYKELYLIVESLKSKYKNVGYEQSQNSVLIYFTPTQDNKEQDKKSNTETNWEYYPCVTKKYAKKTENNLEVYEGDGFIWYGNGVRKDKNGKTSYYHCGADGNPKEGLPSYTGSSTSSQNIEDVSFLDSAIGKITSNIDTSKLTQSVLNVAQNIANKKESVDKKRLIEEINRIKKLL